MSVLSIGISRGRKAGIGFAIGSSLGCLTHTLWAVVGISALIATSQIAFQCLQYAGAVYLLYLGITTLRNSGSFDGIATNQQATANATQPITKYILRGFVTNALNPKVGIFFLAFLPQFMNQSQSVAPQAAVLGSLFALLTAGAFISVGYYSGGVGEWLKRCQHFGIWLDRVAGTLFIGLAGHLILSGRRA